MPVTRLKRFLDEHHVPYVTIIHSPAYTAQQVAQATHIPGKELAKSVMVWMDGEMTMAVVPASYRVDLRQLAFAAGKKDCELASERDFSHIFPGCELGAMPPFGNLWGVSTYVSDTLAEDERIAFSAGRHTEVMVLPYRDYQRLVEPRVLGFSRKVA